MNTWKKRKRLWYREPAEDWEKEALPLGNGRLGVMFFGGVPEEHLQFNEETLYSGQPEEVRENAYVYLDEIRSCLKKRNYSGAQRIMDEKYLEKAAYGYRSNFGAYQNFGDLYLRIRQEGEIRDYVRELDLEQAVGRVSYHAGQYQYTREYFVSHPDNCLVGRMTTDHEQGMDVTFFLRPGLETADVKCEENRICLEQSTGYLKGGAVLEITAEDGTITAGDDEITVKNAGEILFCLTAATEYRADTDDYRGNPYRQINSSILEQVRLQPYSLLKKRHREDYQSLFRRMELEIHDGREEEDSATETDYLLEQYRAGRESRWLETLLFDYARYLLISSSRENTLPANLQGIWNHTNDPEWGCIFCYNINLNMNYWMAQAANLKECHLPMIRFIDGLRKSGRKSAAAYFNARGWFASKKSDVWGYTKPYASGVYGYFVGGSAWLCQDIWEYYDYTRDAEYLENIGFPVLEEAVLFYLDFLTVNGRGEYTANPSASPENSFLYQGESFWLTEGTEINHRLIQVLLENYLKSCRILHKDGEIRKKAEEVLARLAAPRISSSGMLQEWDCDFEEKEPQHRHISMAYGVYPGRVFDQERQKEITEALKKIMNRRGDESTGWSRAWKCAVWAALGEGERAFGLLSGLIRNSLYQNGFCVHPPFQIDGNLGYGAAVTEMLVKDDGKEIVLLPALPEAWSSGSVRGLCLRGGMELSMEWEDGSVTGCLISGKGSGKRTVSVTVNGKRILLTVNQRFSA